MVIKVDNFSLDRTLNSGQIFSFFKRGDYWYSFMDTPIAVRQTGNFIERLGANDRYLKELFGLDDNMVSIKAEIDKDDFIDKSIAYSGSLRVVKQGVWPATLSFILSIQSNINLIMKRIGTMSEFYGKTGEINGVTVNSFPSFESIHERGYETLKQFKLGFRTRFVFSAAEYFYSHEISEKLPRDDIIKHLFSIKGVGEKVLDCILLYGLHDLSAFPMDVWILRTLSIYYNHLINKYKKYTDIRKAMSDYFGRYAGYAQLFIYDYSRLNKIK
jgi:N-glycosylase/DNA lyase